MAKIYTYLSSLGKAILRPKYRIAIEQRVYQLTDNESLLVSVPDLSVQHQTKLANEEANIAVVEPIVQSKTVIVPMPQTIKENYLEVQDVATREVVTVIEILPPKNKRSGEGRKAYEKKRMRVLGSLSHLVEIDLLRAEKSMPILHNNLYSDYRILVSRSDYRPKADLYAFNLKKIIPSLPLPLRPEDAEPMLDLQTLIHQVYDYASYDLIIDYHQEPIPPLSPEIAVWVDALLREQGLR